VPVAPLFPHRSLEAVGFAHGDVARKEVLEKDVLGEERGKESLDQRLRHTVQAFQRVSCSGWRPCRRLCSQGSVRQ